MDNKLLNEYLGNKKSINISKIFTKILLSIIILLSSLIYVKYNDHNRKLFKNYIFNNTLSFSSFQKIYKSLGHQKNEVASVSNNIKYTNKQKYLDGVSLNVSDGLVETFASGIVVYVGKKDSFNNTVIVQGSDGYDIWYGNLEDLNVSIYDYIDKDSIIASSDKVYLKVLKDGKKVNIDEYLKI